MKVTIALLVTILSGACTAKTNILIPEKDKKGLGTKVIISSVNPGFRLPIPFAQPAPLDGVEVNPKPVVQAEMVTNAPLPSQGATIGRPTPFGGIGINRGNPLPVRGPLIPTAADLERMGQNQASAQGAQQKAFTSSKLVKDNHVKNWEEIQPVKQDDKKEKGKLTTFKDKVQQIKSRETNPKVISRNKPVTSSSRPQQSTITRKPPPLNAQAQSQAATWRQQKPSQRKPFGQNDAMRMGAPTKKPFIANNDQTCGREMGKKPSPLFKPLDRKNAEFAFSGKSPNPRQLKPSSPSVTRGGRGRGRGSGTEQRNQDREGQRLDGRPVKHQQDALLFNQHKSPQSWKELKQMIQRDSAPRINEQKIIKEQTKEQTIETIISPSSIQKEKSEEKIIKKSIEQTTEKQETTIISKEEETIKEAPSHKKHSSVPKKSPRKHQSRKNPKEPLEGMFYGDPRLAGQFADLYRGRGGASGRSRAGIARNPPRVQTGVGSPWPTPEHQSFQFPIPGLQSQFGQPLPSSFGRGGSGGRYPTSNNVVSQPYLPLNNLPLGAPIITRPSKPSKQPINNVVSTPKPAANIASIQKPSTNLVSSQRSPAANVVSSQRSPVGVRPILSPFGGRPPRRPPVTIIIPHKPPVNVVPPIESRPIPVISHSLEETIASMEGQQVNHEALTSILNVPISIASSIVAIPNIPSENIPIPVAIPTLPDVASSLVSIPTLPTLPTNIIPIPSIPSDLISVPSIIATEVAPLISSIVNVVSKPTLEIPTSIPLLPPVTNIIPTLPIVDVIPTATISPVISSIVNMAPISSAIEILPSIPAISAVLPSVPTIVSSIVNEIPIPSITGIIPQVPIISAIPPVIPAISAIPPVVPVVVAPIASSAPSLIPTATIANVISTPIATNLSSVISSAVNAIPTLPVGTIPQVPIVSAIRPVVPIVSVIIPPSVPAIVSSVASVIPTATIANVIPSSTITSPIRASSLSIPITSMIPTSVLNTTVRPTTPSVSNIVPIIPAVVSAVPIRTSASATTISRTTVSTSSPSSNKIAIGGILPNRA